MTAAFTRRLALIAGAAVLAVAVHAQTASAQATPVGLWKTIDDTTKQERSLVRISERGGVLVGHIEKRLDPDAKPGELCTKCSDDRKDQPMQGLEIIRNVTLQPDDQHRWVDGAILDPENGKSYRLRLTPVDGGQRLDVRGYIGTPLIGRTQTWIRAE